MAQFVEQLLPTPEVGGSNTVHIEHLSTVIVLKRLALRKEAGEVVVAQLVERWLSIPEVRGSTPVIGKILLSICLLSTVLKRRK